MSEPKQNFGNLKGEAIDLGFMYRNKGVGGLIIRAEDGEYYWINRCKDTFNCIYDRRLEYISTGDRISIKDGNLCIDSAEESDIIKNIEENQENPVRVASVEKIDTFFTGDIDYVKNHSLFASNDHETINKDDIERKFFKEYGHHPMKLTYVSVGSLNIYKEEDNEITKFKKEKGYDEFYYTRILAEHHSDIDNITKEPEDGQIAFVRLGAKIFIFGENFTEPTVFVVNNKYLKKDPEALEMYKEREDRIKQVIEYKSKNNPELGKGKYVEYELPHSTELKSKLPSPEYQRYIEERKNKIRAKLSPESLQTVDSRKNERKKEKREMKSKEIYKNRSYS